MGAACSATSAPAEAADCFWRRRHLTILGAVAVNAELALIWSDTAIFAADTAAPIGHAAKLTVNPAACVAGAGVGWGAVAIEGANALVAAISLDKLVEELPARLRRVAFRVAPQVERLNPGSFSSCMFAIAGWSRQYSRMLVYELSALSAFEPRMATSVCVPELPPRLVPDGACWHGIEAAAQAQMAIFRRMAPETDGELVAVVLRPGSVMAGPLLDFATGASAPFCGGPIGFSSSGSV